MEVSQRIFILYLFLSSVLGWDDSYAGCAFLSLLHEEGISEPLVRFITTIVILKYCTLLWLISKLLTESLRETQQKPQTKQIKLFPRFIVYLWVCESTDLSICLSSLFCVTKKLWSSSGWVYCLHVPQCLCTLKQCNWVINTCDSVYWPTNFLHYLENGMAIFKGLWDKARSAALDCLRE